MRKWAFLILTVAAVAVIGCGGSGGGSVGGPGGPGAHVSSVNLPATPGAVNIQYFTGQGRALGDLTALVNNLSLTDSANQIIAPAPGSVSLSLLLNGYTSQTALINVPVALGSNSRSFANFDLQVASVNGITGPSGANAVDQTFPANFLVETGRLTSFPVYLDDAMITISNGQVVFDPALFQASNIDGVANAMVGFFGDFVMFDISNVADIDKPIMSNASLAQKVYFSGDNIALSEMDAPGAFEMLTPFGVQDGQFTAQQGGTVAPAPGTYVLLVPNPSDLTNTSKVASLQGIYRNFSSVPIGSAPGPLDVIAYPGTFEVIVFPNSAEDTQPDMVMLQRNAIGAITSMYFGGLDYTTSPPSFVGYPISQVVSGDVSNEITGTLPELRDSAGAIVNLPTDATALKLAAASVRSGSWTKAPVVGPDPWPNSWPTSGRFIVFRSSGTDSSVSPTVIKGNRIRPHRRTKGSLRSAKAIRK